ncbi:Fc receptor-like protein 1 [Emydura macquarii macquarii]|uniref:Fc receptor-like protein 1 n=1 Tax=Emydura macquarii macquarii TaxID=1129001 RepID=UPI00352B62AF
MEQPLILPLLASLQLLPRLVSPAAINPAPTFSVHPWKTEYLLGDTVSLICSAPPGSNPVTIFQYYSNMGWAVTAPSSSVWKHTYSLNITAPRDAGSYTCAYYTGKSPRFLHSKQSNEVTIKVKDPPHQPELSVDPPSGAVSEGHPLHITCTAPGDAAERRFNFYQDGEEAVREDAGYEIKAGAPGTDPMKVSVLSFPRVDTNSTGEFSCGYEEKMEGRWIPSVRSRLVTITLKDPPSQPALSVDPPSGEVNEGLPLHLTCTAPGEAAEWRFHFYKDGVKMVPLAAGSDSSTMEPGTSARNVSVLSIPRASPDSAGEFTCGYEENVAGRWVPSPRSRAVNVTMRDPLPRPALSVDPSSREVSEGLPLHITCAAPRNASEWRFHFYKDGAEMVPGNQGSEISTTETGSGSLMLTFPRAGPASAGEFTCGYEEHVGGRWIPSIRSQAVTVSVKANSSLPIPLVAGCASAAVALVLLLLLIYLCRRTRKGSVWQLKRRAQKNGSVSSYSPIPLAAINPDTL